MFPEWSKPLLFVFGYVVLMRWILPALGIGTCMSGACRTAPLSDAAAQRRKGKEIHD